MKRLSSIIAVALALSGCYATTGSDGRPDGGATFSLSLPVVLPELVVVQPGVSVLSDYDQEVFYVDGYYWTRHERSWYRTRDHRGSWTWVEHRYVPSSIAQSPPGRYRHYRGDHQRSDADHGRRDDRG